MINQTPINNILWNSPLINYSVNQSINQSVKHKSINRFNQPIFQSINQSDLGKLCKLQIISWLYKDSINVIYISTWSRHIGIHNILHRTWLKVFSVPWTCTITWDHQKWVMIMADESVDWVKPLDLVVFIRSTR